MTRWWWQGETTPETKARPARYDLYAVGGTNGYVPRPPNQLSGSIGVHDVARWIDHLEGLPPR